MKFRSLIAAAVVLLVLAGVLYWSQHRKTPDDTASTASTSPAILKVDPATVTSLTVKQKGAQPTTLVRSGPQWQITAPGTFPADSGTVTGMLSSLAPLNSESVVEDHATNLAEFGLSDPAVELDVTTKDNKTSHLLLGDDAPTGDGVYVSLAGDPRIFTASSSLKASLNKSLSDLRDKRLLPVEAGSVSSADLIRKGEDIDFSRIQNGWQIEKPKSYQADRFQVDDWLQQVTGARWDASVSSDDAAKTFAHAEPLATVKLTGSFGNDTLDVRKDKEDYYAKSSAVAGTWKVDPTTATSLGQALGHNVDDFRNKQLFDFGYSDPDKIEYHSGSTNLVLTHTGNAWWSNGQKMDPLSVELLVTALRNLTATKFVDSGFASPQIELTVTANGGAKVEKVQIQTSGDGAIAKREDDSSLYSLDATAIDSLTNSIAGIKPATPPKKN
jgi:Domain of unknown function (DUF4340)